MRRFLTLSLAGCALAVGHSLATAQVTMLAVGVSPGAYTSSGVMPVKNSEKGCWWALKYCQESCAQTGGSARQCNSVCMRSWQKCMNQV